MKELHVSTEIKGRTTLEVIGRIIADLWGEYKDTHEKYMRYKEGDPFEAHHTEGILDGLDSAMEMIINTICPDYFIPQSEVGE